ncbi:MAG TPA: hypothetical protein DF409_06690 [Bacteroidales bacterium]|nr:hypothetical protein [Bacteroidales bacterium]
MKIDCNGQVGRFVDFTVITPGSHLEFRLVNCLTLACPEAGVFRNTSGLWLFDISNGRVCVAWPVYQNIASWK